MSILLQRQQTAKVHYAKKDKELREKLARLLAEDNDFVLPMLSNLQNGIHTIKMPLQISSILNGCSGSAMVLILS